MRDISNDVSPVKTIIFITISNILFLSLVCFAIFINNYRSASWLVLLIYMIVFFVFSFLFKGIKKGTNVIKILSKNKVMRTIIIVYITIIVSFLLLSSTIVIKEYFYTRASMIVIITLLLFTSLCLSVQSYNKLINMATVIFVLVSLLYIIPFVHLDERDFLLLLPVDFDIKTIGNAYLVLIFPLETILFAINSDITTNGFSRKTYLISNIFAGLLFMFIIIDSLTLLGANYFIDIRFGSFFRWQVYQGDKFIENYDIFLLVILSSSVIFRLGFYFNTLRKILLIKNSFNYNALVFIIFFVIDMFLYEYINIFPKISEIILIICFFMINIIFFYFCYLSRKKKSKGVYYVQANN